MSGEQDPPKQSPPLKFDPVYYLGSSDGPGNVITPIQLRGDNYDEWARAVKHSLTAKRKFGFVDGSIMKPTDPEKIEDWIAVHSMLVSWINNTLDAFVRSTLEDYDDASVLWTNLKNRFCVVSVTRICYLKMALGECKQGISETVSGGQIEEEMDEGLVEVDEGEAVVCILAVEEAGVAVVTTQCVQTKSVPQRTRLMEIQPQQSWTS
ncbi:uncharacterized protein LOC125369730 [Ricinus communis]|uniref:uncharacterized protein LOC125369730 n=1 Tax=Ricinus communis TaxID=3988 RepID=UPI00201ADE6C|nr:uncharacterized protein LOC125369730 [Ricinus communis]